MIGKIRTIWKKYILPLTVMSIKTLYQTNPKLSSLKIFKRFVLSNKVKCLCMLKDENKCHKWMSDQI